MDAQVMPDINFSVSDSLATALQTVTPESFLQHLKETSFPDMMERFFKWGVSVGGRVVVALLVFLVLHFVIKRINRRFRLVMERRHPDSALAPFLRSLISLSLNTLMVIIIVWILGVKMSGLVALFASAGVAIGLALSGTLQNIAGGIVILMQKPFKIGDYIEAQGYAGTVKEIQIFSTIILTLDNKTVYIPNGSLSTSTLNNYSMQETRRVDWTFSIAYGDSFDKTKEVLQLLITQDSRILADPAPIIAISALADNAVEVAVKVWTLTADYWDVFYQMNENVYKTFAQQGLHIPFPQLDVHIKPNQT